MLITRKNILSFKKHTIEIPISQEELDRIESGEHVQNVVPKLSTDYREFLISGIMPGEFDTIFGVSEEIEKTRGIQNDREEYSDDYF